MADVDSNGEEWVQGDDIGGQEALEEDAGGERDQHEGLADEAGPEAAPAASPAEQMAARIQQEYALINVAAGLESPTAGLPPANVLHTAAAVAPATGNAATVNWLQPGGMRLINRHFGPVLSITCPDGQNRSFTEAADFDDHSHQRVMKHVKLDKESRRRWDIFDINTEARILPATVGVFNPQCHEMGVYLRGDSTNCCEDMALMAVCSKSRESNSTGMFRFYCANSGCPNACLDKDTLSHRRMLGADKYVLAKTVEYQTAFPSDDWTGFSMVLAKCAPSLKSVLIAEAHRAAHATQAVGAARAASCNSAGRRPNPGPHPAATPANRRRMSLSNPSPLSTHTNQRGRGKGSGGKGKGAKGGRSTSREAERAQLRARLAALGD